MAKSKSKKTVKEDAAPPADPVEASARAICGAHGNRPDELLEILHDLQGQIGYIPDRALPVIANALNRSRAEIHGVISFYHDFRREPPGKHIVKMCRAESCQAMHSDDLCEHAERRLGAGFGETSGDGSFTLEAVYCLGNCALSPAAMIDGRLYGKLDPEKFDAIVSGLDKEAAE